MKLKVFFCQFPNPWALRVSGMGGYTSKCEKKSKSLHPTARLSVWLCCICLRHKTIFIFINRQRALPILRVHVHLRSSLLEFFITFIFASPVLSSLWSLLLREIRVELEFWSWTPLSEIDMLRILKHEAKSDLQDIKFL